MTCWAVSQTSRWSVGWVLRGPNRRVPLAVRMGERARWPSATAVLRMVPSRDRLVLIVRGESCSVSMLVCQRATASASSWARRVSPKMGRMRLLSFFLVA